MGGENGNCNRDVKGRYIGGNEKGKGKSICEVVGENGNGKLKSTGIEVKLNKDGSINKRMISKMKDGLTGNMLARPPHSIFEEIDEGRLTPKVFLIEGLKELKQRYDDVEGNTSTDETFITMEGRYSEIANDLRYCIGLNVDKHLKKAKKLCGDKIKNCSNDEMSIQLTDNVRGRYLELYNKKIEEDKRLEEAGRGRGIVHFDSPPIYTREELGLNYLPDEGVV
ncbi:hypothetical protein HOD75_02950 [archaeon]|jgi:hypothetical protein|nr:hypothetical protein [Candidatus Woesearchaeota archaeon]MBT4135615.1 hypothetical protein [archaeon]MBT4241832.1 hypothetical protein [archaeon]MBT4418380.1 hypothetical protein [archaeon]